jgi:hypothetical protein
MSTIGGTATTPLTTALPNKAGKYGLMVVPRMPTAIAAESGKRSKRGQKLLTGTCRQGSSTVNSTPA